MEHGNWIAVDWGTRHLRAWLVSDEGAVLASATNDQIMPKLSPDAFEPTLIDLVAEWLPYTGQIDVIACGMIGPHQGGGEAPYRAVPCAVFDKGEMVVVPCNDPRIKVHVIPGIKQMTPPDVMRGEETQIAGFIANNPKFDGVLCLPRTQTKWVRISAEEVVSFETYITGEMLALLSHQSVLQHVIGEHWDQDAFQDAVAEAMSKPEKIAARLFTLHAGGLVADLSPDTARARLSGLLIGCEIAASRPYWLGQDVVLLGGGALCAPYQGELTSQGAMVRLAEGGDTALVGLAAARKTMLETEA